MGWRGAAFVWLLADNWAACQSVQFGADPCPAEQSTCVIGTFLLVCCLSTALGLQVYLTRQGDNADSRVELRFWRELYWTRRGKVVSGTSL